jgi:hypothetical protein
MPYAYLTDPQLARDFWAIYTVEPDTTTPPRASKTRRRKTGGPRKTAPNARKTATRKKSGAKKRGRN